jgi:hypothetical protein
MKQFAPGLRGGSYSEADDLNMQIEIINGQAFLDRWAGGGWKNISVHKTYEEALHARSEIRAMIQEWREDEREACAEICDRLERRYGDGPELEHWAQGFKKGASVSAKKIRERGQE